MPQYRMVKSLAEGPQLERRRAAVPWSSHQWGLAVFPAGVADAPARPPPGPPSRPLDLSMRDAMQLVKRLGIGSAAKLRDTNLAASTPS
ncbi:MAG: hypothetical protein IPF50_09260 [Proteobacteria bacterium]|nr:hypothetical protein [Pseudomonadota bacterium]